jgi:hypothetical protein
MEWKYVGLTVQGQETKLTRIEAKKLLAELLRELKKRNTRLPTLVPGEEKTLKSGDLLIDSPLIHLVVKPIGSGDGTIATHHAQNDLSVQSPFTQDTAGEFFRTNQARSLTVLRRPAARSPAAPTLKKMGVDNGESVPLGMQEGWKMAAKVLAVRTVNVRGRSFTGKFLTRKDDLESLGIEGSYVRDNNGQLIFVIPEELSEGVKTITLDSPSIFHEGTEAPAEDMVKATPRFHFFNLFRFIPGVAGWLERKARHDAHILASAQQLLAFGVAHPWYTAQLEAMSGKELRALIDEDRSYQHRVIRRYLDRKEYQEVVKREQAIVAEARRINGENALDRFFKGYARHVTEPSIPAPVVGTGLAAQRVWSAQSIINMLAFYGAFGLLYLIFGPDATKWAFIPGIAQPHKLVAKLAESLRGFVRFLLGREKSTPPQDVPQAKEGLIARTPLPTSVMQTPGSESIMKQSISAPEANQVPGASKSYFTPGAMRVDEKKMQFVPRRKLPAGEAFSSDAWAGFAEREGLPTQYVLEALRKYPLLGTGGVPSNMEDYLLRIRSHPDIQRSFIQDLIKGQPLSADLNAESLRVDPSQYRIADLNNKFPQGKFIVGPSLYAVDDERRQQLIADLETAFASVNSEESLTKANLTISADANHQIHTNIPRSLPADLSEALRAQNVKEGAN